MSTLQLLLMGEYQAQRELGVTAANARTRAVTTMARRFDITRAHAELELDAALKMAHSTPVMLIA